MTSPAHPRDDLRAAVAARRDLGPEYEDAIVESFLDKMDEQIDRRVQERLGARPAPAPAVRPADNHRLALAIVSLGAGVVGSMGAAFAGADKVALMIWIGVVLVNIAFNAGHRRSSG